MVDDPDEPMFRDLEARRKFWKPSNPLPTLSEAEADDVLARLRDRAIGGQQAHELATVAREAAKPHYADPADVRSYLGLVRALRRSGKITFAEYVLQAGHRLEGIVDYRTQSGAYASELDPVTDAMRQIEADHGLAPDEYWMRVDMPDDYSALSDIYDEITASKLPLVMDEFGEGELAELLRADQSTYDRLREEGRLSIFEKENTDAALTTLIANYEDQARRATDAGAYLAACLMWGAAAEARLLLRCLQELDVALATRDQLGKDRPRRDDPARWTLEQLVLVTAKAGWLGTIEEEDFVFYVEGLIGQLRGMRNLVHPGRCIIDRPHLLVDASMCDDARTAYLALRIVDQKRLEGQELKSGGPIPPATL